LHFLLHPIFHALEHCAATSKNNASEQIPPDVPLALNDRVVRVLMDAVLRVLRLLPPVTWLEQYFWALERLSIHFNGLGAGQLVILWRNTIVLGCFQLGVEIVRNLTVLVLNVTSDFISFSFFLVVGQRDQIGIAFVQEVNQVVGQIVSTDGDLGDEVGNGVALIDWHRVSDALSSIHYRSCGAARREK